MLEAQWKGNIIALFLIDKKSGKHIYSKNFSILNEKEQEKQEILADGLKNIIDMINISSESKKELRIIDKENVKFIIKYGERIISCLIVSKNLINVHYFLNVITSQFENTFKDIYEQGINNIEIFKVVDKIIEAIFPGI